MYIIIYHPRPYTPSVTFRVTKKTHIYLPIYSSSNPKCHDQEEALVQLGLLAGHRLPRLEHLLLSNNSRDLCLPLLVRLLRLLPLRLRKDLDCSVRWRVLLRKFYCYTYLPTIHLSSSGKPSSPHPPHSARSRIKSPIQNPY